MKLRQVPLFFFCLAFVLNGCGEPEGTLTASSPAQEYIVAVNTPLQYFADRLLNDELQVIMPAPPNTDPSQWKPSVDDVQQLQGASLILLNGAGYSPWLDKISLSRSRTLVTSGSAASWIPLEKQVTHSHGPEGEHAHGDYAFTTWMDLNMAAAQAQVISAALQRRMPARASAIAARDAELVAELRSLDVAYMQAARLLKAYQPVYSHPVYQYFEARYELPGLSLHWEPDSMPSETQWKELTQAIGENPLFIWEAEPDPSIADRLRSMGIAQVVIDPGANLDGDWLALQRKNVAALTGLANQTGKP